MDAKPIVLKECLYCSRRGLLCDVYCMHAYHRLNLYFLATSHGAPNGRLFCRRVDDLEFKTRISYHLFDRVRAEKSGERNAVGRASKPSRSIRPVVGVCHDFVRCCLFLLNRQRWHSPTRLLVCSRRANTSFAA